MSLIPTSWLIKCLVQTHRNRIKKNNHYTQKVLQYVGPLEFCFHFQGVEKVHCVQTLQLLANQTVYRARKMCSEFFFFDLKKK